MAVRMRRLYHEVREIKRRSRDQKRSDLDFLIRNATIRDRIRSIDTEQLGQTSRRLWNRVQVEQPKPILEKPVQRTENVDWTNTNRLPPITEGDSIPEHSHQVIMNENDQVS
ncbi:hypothetical protein FBUS_02054 [Fasciolopsis buskii]|uniref:Uncharacterized protein n=1 Tax=Fasciolopsis buskii TaxID=27845 RepID=A0A8E0VH46_9TREM|nr:hypothetical protein FBUS_02054 [Fasciolopsis buski]